MADPYFSRRAAASRSAMFAVNVFVCLQLLVGHEAAAADGIAVEAGMRIRDAVRILEAAGLRVLYSTDVLRARMRVADDPTESAPARILDEILAPVGLTTLPAPDGSLLIVPSGNAAETTLTSRPPPSTPAMQPDEDASPPKLEELIVAASRYQLGRALGSSQAVIDQADIEYSPDIGEDALRAVSRLPGIASNGVSSRYNVRGGEIGETLVRLDGMRLYDPFHLKDYQSIFSTLDPRAVDSMNVYTGGFPAAYGNRMSSVIDIESMSPPERRYHEIGMSFFNSSFLSSGLFDDAKGEWLVSARRSNLDLLYDAFSRQVDRPNYRDSFAKLSHQMTDDLRVSGSVLYSHDDVSLADDVDREERAHSDHSDAYYWISFDYAPGNELSGRVLLARSDLASARSGVSAKDGISQGQLSEQKSFTIESVQTDWTWGLTDKHSLAFGMSVDQFAGRYDYDDEVQFELLFDYPGAPNEVERSRSETVLPKGRQLAAYTSLRLQPTPRVTADIGIRWDRLDIESVDGDTLSPRVGLWVKLAQKTDLRISWGRFSQSQTINELQVSDGITTFFRPQRSDHSVIGIQHSFQNSLTLRVEAYDKSMSHLRPRFENVLNSLILLPELKPDRIRIEPRSAHARGVELMLEHKPDKQLGWWASYSYAWVKDQFADEAIYRSWDQTHTLSAGMNWSTPKWNFSIDLLHRTGWPTSRIALLAGDGDDTALANVLGRNAERLGNFRSIDFQVTRMVPLRRGELSLNFELVNAFDRRNPCCVEYEIGQEEEAGLLLTKTLTYLPRIPSLGFLWKF